jgi:hypothetical protein
MTRPTLSRRAVAARTSGRTGIGADTRKAGNSVALVSHEVALDERREGEVGDELLRCSAFEDAGCRVESTEDQAAVAPYFQVEGSESLT